MGFDTEVDGPVVFNMEDDIRCGICQSIFKEPHHVLCCQAHFCKKCLDIVRQTAMVNNLPPNCPNCRHENFNSEKARFLGRILSTFRLKCPVNECTMSVLYEQFEEHRKDCLALQLRKELGAKGGAGEFFGNDKVIWHGGVRDWMKEEELRKLLKLVALGEERINLKEREFLFFESENAFRKTLDRVSHSS